MATINREDAKPGRLHQLLCQSLGQTKDPQTYTPKWRKQQQQGTQGIPRTYLRESNLAELRTREASAQEGPATRATIINTSRWVRYRWWRQHSRAWPRAPLALWTRHRQKNVICPFMQEESTNPHYSYNTIGYTNSYLKSLVQHIHRSHTHILRMCEIMRSATKSLVHCGKLRDDNNFSAIAKGLKQYI